MKPKTKLFWILWTAGMLGVLSFLLVDLEAVIRAVPQPEGTAPVDLPPPWLFKIVTLIQPTVIMTIAVLVGVWLASRVGLHAPGVHFWHTGTVIASQVAHFVYQIREK